MHALSECASNLWAYYGHAWWCWQPRSVCQNDLLVCPLINYSLEAAAIWPAGRHQLLGLFSWNAPGCCWYLLLNSWPIWDRNVSKITKWGCEEQHRQRSLQLASYHHHKAPFLCWSFTKAGLKA